MKKLYLLVLGLILSFLPLCNINAEEIYYTNPNGVSFTKEQYDFYTDMFYEGYQEYVLPSDFEEVMSRDLIGRPIQKNTYVDPVDFKNMYYTRGTSLTEKGRTIVISSTCNSDCFITLTNTWNSTPTVKSWDVFGARGSGATITSIGSAVMSGTGYAVTYTTPKTGGNGFGYSMQMPNTTNVVASVAFFADTGGTIYGTYQHATVSISQSDSKKYNIAYYGYGGVFSFYGAAYGVYDGCNGVNVSV